MSSQNECETFNDGNSFINHHQPQPDYLVSLILVVMKPDSLLAHKLNLTTVWQVQIL